MGKLNIITQGVELLENYKATNAERINAKFEALEMTLERKFVNMEKYLLTSNLDLVSDSVFVKVKEIIAGLPKEVVAKI